MNFIMKFIMKIIKLTNKIFKSFLTNQQFKNTGMNISFRFGIKAYLKELLISRLRRLNKKVYFKKPRNCTDYFNKKIRTENFGK